MKEGVSYIDQVVHRTNPSVVVTNELNPRTPYQLATHSSVATIPHRLRNQTEVCSSMYNVQRIGGNKEVKPLSKVESENYYLVCRFLLPMRHKSG